MTDLPWHIDGRLHFGVGIEDTFIASERTGQRKLDEYELTQHYHHWREDLHLAAQSGATLIRWGSPWYLVEPEEGRFDFRWLDQVMTEMRRLGLRCVLDVMHYGTPLWLSDAFLNPRYPELVARYAAAVAQRYPGVVDDLTPLNEPMINAVWCGRDGRWPPYLTGEDGLISVLIPLAQGIVATQRAVAVVRPEMRFVHVDAGFLWKGRGPSGTSVEHGETWRFLALDLVTGRVGPEHPLYQHLLTHGARPEALDALRRDAVQPDVVGVNYYPAFTTQSVTAEGVETPVEAGTHGLASLVTAYHERYHLPLAITETSRATPDVTAKAQWVDELIDTVDRLRANEVPLAGVFWFPLLDLVDWSYRDGTDPVDHYLMPFGLVDLVRGPDNVLARVPNAAYTRWRERAKTASPAS